MSGLRTFKGSQIAVDATLVSSPHCDGTACIRAHGKDGAVLQNAQKKKTWDYPEFVGEDGCFVLTAGMKIEGRFFFV